MFNPVYGAKPALTLNNSQYANNMTDVIRELHCTGLGWISSYMTISPTLADSVNVDSIRANASKMQNEFGYQFVISNFTSTAKTAPGKKLKINFKIRNTGAAPFYYRWPVAIVLIDEASRQIKKTIVLPNIDITTWMPGDDYDYNKRAYLSPAKTNKISASVKISKDLPKGSYLVGLSILEPNSQSPGIFFAIENFFKESQSQPLMRIGVGVDVENNMLNNFSFNDPQKDDARYYSLTPTKAVNNK